MAGRFDLQGRTCLVTGGSRGLGKAMAQGLAEAGADIFLVARDEEELKAASGQISAETDRACRYAVADLADVGEAQRAVREAEEAFGAVDILVSNAGMSSVQAIDAVTDEVWQTMMSVQLTAAMALTRAVAPGMKERGWGRVIYTSSMAAYASLPGRSAYSATKLALVGLAKSAAIDLGPYGITVNCLVPGPFPTELVLASFPSEEAQQALRDKTALGRFGLPDDLVGPVLLLASDAGSFITGSALVVDGGVLGKM